MHTAKAESNHISHNEILSHCKAQLNCPNKKIYSSIGAPPVQFTTHK